MAGAREWEVEEEGEVEKLESDVREMCKKISEYRQTILPDHHLMNTTALSSPHHTPNVDSGSDPLPSSKPLTISAEIALVLLGTEKQECGQRMIQLQETVSRNAANTHILVKKRMRECVEGIDKLDSVISITIHPAFRRKSRITP